MRDKRSPLTVTASTTAPRGPVREIRRRKHQRIEIDSPVTVGLRVLNNGGHIKFGHLADIGERGARLCLEQPLRVDAPIHLLVHFRDPYERVITLGFDAVVVRAQQEEPYMAAVRFQSGPRYFSGNLADFLKQEKRKKFGTRSDVRPQGQGKGRRAGVSRATLWLN